jgi:hypothetical protein
VRTNPAGATIIVRRGSEIVAQGPAPFAHTLDQGRYNVTVEHPDFQTVDQDVRIEPGKVYVVIVEMSQGQFLGYLRIVSDVPGAQVFIDDREQGARGQTPLEAPIDRHAPHLDRSAPATSQRSSRPRSASAGTSCSASSQCASTTDACASSATSRTRA